MPKWAGIIVFGFCICLIKHNSCFPQQGPQRVVIETETSPKLEYENLYRLSYSNTILDACQLSIVGQTVGYVYRSDLELEFKQITFFDPSTCAGSPTYPFAITSLDTQLHLWPGDVCNCHYPADLYVVIYDMLDPLSECEGPGEEIWRFQYSCDESFQWPLIGTIPFPSTFYAEGPFFIGLDYIPPIMASVTMDYFPSDDVCDSWWWLMPQYGWQVVQTDNWAYWVNGRTGATLPEAPAEEWTITFGEPENQESGNSVIQTSDGGYAIVGTVGEIAQGTADIYLVKIDQYGTQEWWNSYGGEYNDIGWSVCQTPDNGFFVLGETESFGDGPSSIYLVKVDAAGVEEWSETYGGIGSDFGRSIHATTDGSYIITGMLGAAAKSGDDIYLIEIDADGNEIWSNSFDGFESNDAGYSIKQTSDGGFIIAGSTSYPSDETEYFYLLKTDINGDEVWSNQYGGANGGVAFCAEETSDGGFIAVGNLINDPAGDTDIFLVKTDVSGNEMWTRTFGGDQDDIGLALLQLPRDEYIIVGGTSSFGEGMYLIKVNPFGYEILSSTYGVPTGHSICQASDVGYVITGTMNSDIYLTKLEVEVPGECIDYVIGDYNGNGVFNLADILMFFDKLTQVPDRDPYVVCQCPAGADPWPMMIDLNNNCAANLSDVIWGFGRLSGIRSNLKRACRECPPEGWVGGVCCVDGVLVCQDNVEESDCLGVDESLNPAWYGGETCPFTCPNAPAPGGYENILTIESD